MVEACILLFHRCVDPDNYKVLIGAFKWKEEIAEITGRLEMEIQGRASSHSAASQSEPSFEPVVQVIEGKKYVQSVDERSTKMKVDAHVSKQQNTSTIKWVGENIRANEGLESLNLAGTHNPVETLIERSANMIATKNAITGSRSSSLKEKFEALNDSEFLDVFGKTKAEFASLPKWKGDNLKKTKGFF